MLFLEQLFIQIPYKPAKELPYFYPYPYVIILKTCWEVKVQ